MKEDGDSDVMERAMFLFHPDAVKAADEPSRVGIRLVWMIVRLVQTGEIALDQYVGTFSMGVRTFKRDVAKLRELGHIYGFTLGRQLKGRIRLDRFDRLPGTKPAATPAALADTLRAVTDALGDVIGRQLAGHVDVPGGNVDRFLRIATPRLTAHSLVADRYAALREAWRRKARVRFRYPGRGRGAALERVVEPYLTTYVAGRYYLVGFDTRVTSGGWRQYALDRIVGPIAPAGTFARRPIPAAYRGEDAVGLFKTGAPATVTIALSPTIAEAVIGREWQRAQRTVRDPSGGATIAFEVYDLAEAVRWALGFGDEARIIAPPVAVEMCRNMALAIAARHAPDFGTSLQA